MPVETSSSTRRWWIAGHVFDIVHLPLVVALIVAGWPVLGGPVFVAIITVVVVVQLAFLGCPCVAVSTRMKQRHKPEFEGGWSFTVWLYERYGAIVALPVFLALLAAGATFAWLW